MLGGRFKAAPVVEASAPQIHKTVGLTALFQSRLAATPKKPLPPETPQEESAVLTVALEEKAENLIS